MPSVTEKQNVDICHHQIEPEFNRRQLNCYAVDIPISGHTGVRAVAAQCLNARF